MALNLPGSFWRPFIIQEVLRWAFHQGFIWNWIASSNPSMWEKKPNTITPSATQPFKFLQSVWQNSIHVCGAGARDGRPVLQGLAEGQNNHSSVCPEENQHGQLPEAHGPLCVPVFKPQGFVSWHVNIIWGNFPYTFPNPLYLTSARFMKSEPYVSRDDLIPSPCLQSIYFGQIFCQHRDNYSSWCWDPRQLAALLLLQLLMVAVITLEYWSQYTSFSDHTPSHYHYWGCFLPIT